MSYIKYSYYERRILDSPKEDLYDIIEEMVDDSSISKEQFEDLYNLAMKKEV